MQALFRELFSGRNLVEPHSKSIAVFSQALVGFENDWGVFFYRFRFAVFLPFSCAVFFRFHFSWCREFLYSFRATFFYRFRRPYYLGLTHKITFF